LEIFGQNLIFFYQILTAFNNLKILSELVLLPNTDSFRRRTSSEKNLQIVEGDQYLVEVEQALAKISNCSK
jgi:hypothetical protein